LKLAVTGLSGLLGLNAAVALRDGHEVCGAYLDHGVSLRDVAASRIDVSDAAGVRRWIESERPDAVLHAAGLTNVDACETNPALAERLNVDVAGYVAAAASGVGASLIHVSTDHLFDGREALYGEDHPPSPLNVYARTKLAAEHRVRDHHERPYIIRTNFYGWGHPGRQSFSDWILACLRKGERLRMFHDVYFTPILINDLVSVLGHLIERAQPGTYNVAGGERLSKYEFGVALASTFGLDAGLVEAVSVETFAFKARRPHDMSLATAKVERVVGYPMPKAADGIDRLARLERDGLPGTLAGALAVARPDAVS
jgi:dTDP-4-dehydrorhamnose reductase